MSDKENKSLPVALLVAGIGCIMIFSCCFVWLVVRCERWRRRRKYRPKGGNRYSINASHMANGQELTDLQQPRHLKPSVNLIHYSSKNSVTSQSIPSLLSAGDSMMDADSIASEPLYPSRRNYDGGQDETDYLPPQHRDLSIARILGSFPELPYYQPPSGGSSAENIAKRTTTAVPIPRPRSTNVITPSTSRSKDFSINPSLYTAVEYKSVDSMGKGPDATSTRSASSAESLKVEIPGGAIRARDMSDLFEFTKLRGKKSKVVSGNAIKIMDGNSIAKGNSEAGQPSSNSTIESSKSSKPTFETEV